MITTTTQRDTTPPPTTLTQRADAIVAAEKVRNIAALLNELARAKKFPATAKQRHKAWRDLLELAGQQMLASLVRAPSAAPEPEPDAVPFAEKPPVDEAPPERLTVEKAAPLFTSVRDAVNAVNDLPEPPRNVGGLPNSMSEP